MKHEKNKCGCNWQVSEIEGLGEKGPHERYAAIYFPGIHRDHEDEIARLLALLLDTRGHSTLTLHSEEPWPVHALTNIIKGLEVMAEGSEQDGICPVSVEYLYGLFNTTLQRRANALDRLAGAKQEIEELEEDVANIKMEMEMLLKRKRDLENALDCAYTELTKCRCGTR